MAREPEHGSVILAHGWTGTAYQRFFSDGKWHGTNGRVLTWAEVSAQCAPTPIIVIHDAPAEQEEE